MGVLTRLSISCDGDGTPEEYERLRPPSKWSKFIEFLETVKELKEKYAPRLVLMTRSVCETPEGRERWRKVLETRGWAPEFRNWLYLPESVKNMKTCGPAVPKGVCAYLKRKKEDELYVDWDGTVVPCCVHPRAAVLGNLMNERYTAIRKGKARAQFVEGMANNRLSLTICNQCEF